MAKFADNRDFWSKKIRAETTHDVNKIKNGKIILKLKLGKDSSRC